MRPLAPMLAMLLLAVGCGPSDVSSRLELADRYVPGQSENLKTQVERAPVIVVGNVKAVTAIGSPRYSARLGAQLKLQLTQVTISQPVCLRGCKAVEELVFYSFSYAGSARGYTGPPLFRASPGDRRVLFLEWEKGILRTQCDLVDCSYRLPAGSRKASEPLGVGQTIRDYLARLFVEVDERLVATEIATRLRIGVAAATSLVGERKTMLLLRSIMKNGPVRMRMRACLILAETFPGQDDCLSDLAAAKSDEHDAPFRLATIVASNHSRDAQIRRRLKYLANGANALHISKQEVELACSEIEVWLLHRDITIREEAGKANFALCRGH